ncbi:MAG: Ala-tRNA(Pro) hydrolase, partial [Rhodospirillaceae bacterium]|nr:Ala-tRNA(Pro) hydrolase [Rhodospirillaceae bacterium]
MAAMTTELLFAEDDYARSCKARVTATAPGAIQLDRTVFYFTSGGQPGDSGMLRLADGTEFAV